MKRYPIVFSIAGSDCTGGAGIQADTKTISALGAYAATAITAISVQNTMGIKAIYPIPSRIIKEQIEAIMEDLAPDVVKIGLINDTHTARTIADCLRKYHPQYVVFDPVMLSINGTRMLQDSDMEVIKNELFPFSNLIIMTHEEAGALTEMKINTTDEMRAAAKELTTMTRMSVLIKGGYLLGDHKTFDVLRTPSDEEWIYKDDRISSPNTHGTECTFSSAIATNIALGYPLQEAVMKAKMYVRDAILNGKDAIFGNGKGPICHTFNPLEMQVIDGVR